ncbi:methylmalonyl-CoA mutase family protein [Conexibacter sp. CPCC 206217]|uniref:methylmalonyl-CoA mutase family protein n=1 Tax=Conexibacter sp. CPCC 206217 TaxID=3064574 RepID=UPI00271E9EEF|nr:methylmalonyl-CoA mutase family protein [Conexibacter sp. CPCC 206217]MDO8211107.1 methylmalonyl-CoA mutase family protein [Conexibacter sp. CPCC 206217]
MTIHPDGARATRAFYTAEDVDPAAAAERPGSFPFRRGIHPEMYRERLWRMRQYAGFGTPEDTNERWKQLIAKGQHGISAAFDLPTQLGLDSDDPRANDDAGRLGVAVDTLDDVIAMFDGIPLGETAATFNINAAAPVMFALLLETADAQGVPLDRLTGTLSNDPLIEFVARGLWRVPPAGAMRLMADTYAYALRHTPSYYPVNLRGTLVYEAGGSVIHEFAFAFACACACLDALRERDVDMEVATARFSFLFFADSNLLEEACAFRAARVLWAELVRDRYGVEAPSGQRLRFSAAIGNFNLRAQYPELNLVRNTLGALGAVLGGCQAMLVAGMDEAFEIPSEYSSLLGLYTQQVIAYESKLPEVVDPLGGSYYVEATTDRLLAEMRATLAEVDEAGGAIAAIEDGLMQRAITDAAYSYQLEEESGQRMVVGVNTPGSPPLADPDFDLHEHDNTMGARKRAALAAHRAARPAALVQQRLDELTAALDGDGDTIDPMRLALRAGATVGEIMDRCVVRYGEYAEPGTVV